MSRGSTTDDYARMCNLPMGGGGGYRPYGRDALTAGPVHEYDFSPDYHPSSEQQEALPFYDSQERKYFLLLFLYKEKCRPFSSRTLVNVLSQENMGVN